ncbi:hydrogenase maturation protease [bacterium]|nr:hydrogenase maturation protease [bacterium]
MQTKIICIGNRLKAQDAAALHIHDLLQNQSLPKTINLIEGGLAGLNLLPLLEDGGRIVFVDTVSGFAEPGKTVVLSAKQVVDTLATEYYDHTAGLPYLLAALPLVCDGAMPDEILLLGIEDYSQNEPANEDSLLLEAASIALELAKNGFTKPQQKY